MLRKRLLQRWLAGTLVGLLLGLMPLWVGAIANSSPAQPIVPSQLTLGVPSAPTTFNPALSYTFPNVFLLTFAGLTRENGMTGAVEPDLAESWQFVAANTRVIFTLRQGLRWSDGKPLTVDDVVFTYRDVVANPAIPTDWRDSLRIGATKTLPTVRKLDDRRVEFTLPEPFAPLLRVIAGIGILPRHQLADRLQSRDRDGTPQFISTWTTDTDPTQIVSNGPYRLVEYIPGRQMTFQRNPYYWRSQASGKALPAIERVVWTIVDNPDAELAQFLAGKLDVVGAFRPLQATAVSQLQPLERQDKLRIYQGGEQPNSLFLTFNQTAATDEAGRPVVDPVKARWFKSLAFRQAIAYAINRDAINQTVFDNMGVLQNSPIPASSPFYTNIGQPYDYNPTQARKLLQTAGFRYNAQGRLLDREGHPVSFTLLTHNNQRRNAIADHIKRDLDQLGMQVDLAVVSLNTWIEAVANSRRWDAVLMGVSGGVDPHFGANFWMSDGSLHIFNLKPQPGTKPVQNWQITDMERTIDRLFQAAAQEVDDTRRRQLYARFQQLVRDQVPVIYLVGDRALMSAHQRLKGIQYSGLGAWGLWNIEELELVL